MTMTPALIVPQPVEWRTATRSGVFLRLAVRMPLVTPLIIGVNVLVFIAMGRAGAGWSVVDVQRAVNWGADFWPLTSTGQWWRLLTSAFVHFGSEHLLSNMSALVVAGIAAECRVR